MTANTTDRRDATRRWGLLGVAALAWAGGYAVNEVVWTWLYRDQLGLDITGDWPSMLHFFSYDTVKILLLLTGLMFVIGMLRASLDLDRARSFLDGKGLFVGLGLAVVLGAC